MESVGRAAGSTSAGALSCPARLVSAFFAAIASKKVKRVVPFVLEYPDEWKTVVNEVFDTPYSFSQHYLVWKVS